MNDLRKLVDIKNGANVRDMFNSIAHRYDLANHLLSLGIDRSWRRRTRRELGALFAGKTPRILDVCCGTGDLSFELSRLGPVVGLDFAGDMLQFGRAKLTANPAAICFLEGDGLALPFMNHSFDVVSAAFGVRNFESLASGLSEMARVLRPSGALAILEFSRPYWPGFSGLFNFYFFRVLPVLGGFITGHVGPYRYLPASVKNFLDPEELKGIIRRLGFEQIQAMPLTGGVATLYLARKTM